MSRAGRQSHAAHPQTNLILQYDDWQVKKTFLELFIPKKKCQIKKTCAVNRNLVFYSTDGAVAQLGARLHGMEEVKGSNPLCSIG